VQIEYGPLTDPEGRPVAVRVLAGNTAGPAAFAEIAGVVKDTFGLKRMVMVGDCGMITSARIEALRELDDKYAWITALRSGRRGATAGSKVCSLRSRSPAS
jgi:transposase